MLVRSCPYKLTNFPFSPAVLPLSAFVPFEPCFENFTVRFRKPHFSIFFTHDSGVVLLTDTALHFLVAIGVVASRKSMLATAFVCYFFDLLETVISNPDIMWAPAVYRP